MRTLGAKGKPKTFNVSIGQLKKILNFENNDTVLEVSIKYLSLLGLSETQIISAPNVINLDNSIEKDKNKPVEIARAIDLSEL
jgi:hypothetical protein